MTDPYRTSGFPCPGCKSAGMRPLGTRLICDHCEAMMLERDDLEGNLGAAAAVAIVDDGRADAMACPRCLQAMRTCELQVNEHAYGHFPYCAQDGIWFEAEALIELFSKVNLSGRGGPYFGYEAGVYVGARRDRRAPLKFAIPTSPHEGTRLGCPVCPEALHREHDRWPCGGCSGAFVENGALEAMVMDMVGQPWAMPAPSGAGGERKCPVCAERMIVEQLEAVTIDRCGAHGVWFDPTELGTMLHSVGSDRRRGVIGWLKRVF